MAYRLSIPTIKPISTSSLFSKSAIGLGGSPSWYSRPSGPSATQLLSLAAAKKVSHHTFGDRLKGIGLGVAHPFEVGLHELLRTSTAVAAGALAAQNAKGDAKFAAFYHGAGKGFHHPGSVSFSDVLKNSKDFGHYFKTHKIQAGIAGLGLDVVADPLTYATLGAGAAAKAGEEAAFQASKIALETGNVTKHGANVAAIPHLTTAVDTLKAAGPRYGFARTLAQDKIEAINAIKNAENLQKAAEARGAEWNAAASDKIITAAATRTHVGARAAWMEHFNNTLRPLQIGVRLGKRSATLNTRIPLPKIGEAMVNSNIPVVSKLAGAGRKAFGSGKGDWERALRVVRKHIVEERAHSYHITAENIAKQMPKLSEKEALHAFDWYERAGAVRKTAKGEWRLDANKALDMVKKGKLSEKQYHFLVKWDEFSNVMLSMDKAAGIQISHVAERTGGGYVSHIFEGDKLEAHIPNDMVREFLKKAGHTRMRNVDMTLKTLNDLHTQGKLADKLVTDPFHIMVKMGRARANAQADQAVYHVLTDAFGVPAKIAVKAIPQKELDFAKSRLAAVQKKIHDRTLGPISEHPAGAKAKSTSAVIEQSRTDMKRLIAVEKKWSDRVDALSKPVTKMVKNPDVHGQMVTFKDADGKMLLNAEGQKIKIEPEGQAAFQRYQRILTDPKERLQFNSTWQKWMGKWKVGVTSINIGGYRLRNSMSDMWNMYLDGVPLRAIPKAGGLAAHFMLRVNKGDPKALSEFLQLYHSGALSGVFGGDVSLLAQELSSGHTSAMSAARQGRLLKAGSRASQTFNRNAENLGRLTHYMYRTRMEGMDSATAIEHVRDAHFDYEDLTPTEQSIKSKFIPFYTWTRKDVPYQLKQLVQHPGRYATFPKAVVESEKAAGTQGDMPPSYLDSALSFKVPGMGYLTPQIGVSDVARFQNPKQAIQNVTGMTNPVLKAFAELSLNKQFYTGQPIKDPAGHARAPVSNWLAPLLGMIPGTDVGTTSRRVQGKQIFGQGANPYAMYFVNQLPMTRYLATAFNPITRDKRGIGSELSYFAGLSTTKQDKQAALLSEQLQLQARIQAVIKKLRDEGRYPQAKQSVSKNQQRILDALAKNLRRGR